MASNKMTMLLAGLVLLISGSIGINTYQKCNDRGNNMDVNRNFFIFLLIVAILLLLAAGFLWWRELGAGYRLAVTATGVTQ